MKPHWALVQPDILSKWHLLTAAKILINTGIVRYFVVCLQSRTHNSDFENIHVYLQIRWKRGIGEQREIRIRTPWLSTPLCLEEPATSLNLHTTTMSSKSAKPTDEEILALFDEDEAKDGTAEGDSKVAPQASTSPDADPDLIPELLSQRQRPTSRPHTPRLPSSTTTQSSKASPRRTGVNTPPSNDGARSSEEKAPPRKSGESSRSFHTSFTPVADDDTEPEHEKRTTATPPAAQAQNSGGGWWGGIFATASAAVKQAEALAKEIQHNEEAQRWAEQVKGNVGALRGLGNPLSSLSPTTKSPQRS